MEVGARDRDCGFGLIHLPQKEIGESIPRIGAAGVVGGVAKEGELAARKPVANLPVYILANLTAEADGVLAVDPGRAVDELQSVVVVLVRTFRAVTESVVAIDADAGDAP